MEIVIDAVVVLFVLLVIFVVWMIWFSPVRCPKCGEKMTRYGNLYSCDYCVGLYRKSFWGKLKKK